LIYVITVDAQHANLSCGFEEPPQSWENTFYRAIQEQKNNPEHKKLSSINYTIPIIFHVIHSGQPIGTFPNISQGQIDSQIAVLNQDFSGAGMNSNTYPENAFVNWAMNQALPADHTDNNGRVKIADSGIQFCLATQDTLGNILSEPGIERIDYNLMGWTDPNSFATQTDLANYLNTTIKPQSIWNVAKYLNVWVSDKNAEISYLGVATYPPFAGLTGLFGSGTDSTDGIWCYTKAIGSNSLFPNGIYGSAFVEGRTLTHEIGHYLGLRHISGDGFCATDYCDDTPPAATQNSGTPVSYPFNAGSCDSPTNAPDGEMFMNFMDYTWDPFKYMFTTDQAFRMQTAMLNSPFRNQLGTHGLCSSVLGLNDDNINHRIAIYPNPAKTELNINHAIHEIDDVTIIDLFGHVLMKSKNQNHFDVSHLSNGIYIIVLKYNHDTFTYKFIKE
jgi:hypothetical protein